MMKQAFVVTFKWMDDPEAKEYQLYFGTEQEARDEMAKMVKEQRDRAASWDPASKDKLQITIDKFVFGSQIACELA